MFQEVDAILKSCEQADLHINPPRPEPPQDSLSQAEGIHGKDQNGEHEEAPLRVEASDVDESVRIEMLEMALDMQKTAMQETLHMHKIAMQETLAERMKALYERDCTIRTQCFHIVALDQSLQEQAQEKKRLDQLIADQRNQLEVFTSRDWQSLSGVRKKRKLDELIDTNHNWDV